MAGDWIIMRMDLARDPAVVSMACALGIDEDAVVGKLHRLWSWASEQTINGQAPNLTEVWLDSYVRQKGFSRAMEHVGWLKINEVGICFPKFEEYNSESAKTRAMNARHAARHRAKVKSKAPNLTNHLRSSGSPPDVSMTEGAPIEEHSLNNTPPKAPPKGGAGASPPKKKRRRPSEAEQAAQARAEGESARAKTRELLNNMDKITPSGKTTQELRAEQAEKEKHEQEP